MLICKQCFNLLALKPTATVRWIHRQKTVLRKTHYDALQISKKATQNEIKEAYYRLSKLYHPDKLVFQQVGIALAFTIFISGIKGVMKLVQYFVKLPQPMKCSEIFGFANCTTRVSYIPLAVSLQINRLQFQRKMMHKQNSTSNA